MGLFSSKKVLTRDIPASTRGYLIAELKWIEQAWSEQRCSGYLYAKAVAGKKALASEKLSKNDLQVLLEIVLAMREMMTESSDSNRSEEELAAHNRLLKNNTEARNVLYNLLA